MRPARLLFLPFALGLGAQAQDLDRLPDYRPEQQVSGVLRTWGSGWMGSLMKNWENGFRRYQPGIFFSDSLRGTASAPFGLFESQADLALMGRQLFTYEYYGIYRRSLLAPTEIAVAGGSLDVPHKSYALTLFVHAGNPLQRLTIAQLDGIFGGQRTGGWQGLQWNRKGARGPEADIRTWGQLGLTGEWANRPIHPYGPPGVYPGAQTFFQARVLAGGDTWAEGLREYEDRHAMMEALSRDPLGIAYTGLCYRTASTKPVAIAETAAGPYVLPTHDTVQARAYPLSRLVYLYFAPDTPGGEPAAPDPKIREFLRYVLSRQGQADVAREGDYLPLTPQLVREQLNKLQ